MGPAQPLVGASVGSAHWQPIVNEWLSGPAQPLPSATVGPTHKQPAIKEW